MDRETRRIACQLGVKGELLFEAERRKQLLANTVLILLRDALNENPENDTFSISFTEPIGRLERYMLTHNPEDISGKMRTKHEINLSFDGSVEPPLLTVSIGKTRSKKP